MAQKLHMCKSKQKIVGTQKLQFAWSKKKSMVLKPTYVFCLQFAFVIMILRQITTSISVSGLICLQFEIAPF